MNDVVPFKRQSCRPWLLRYSLPAVCATTLFLFVARTSASQPSIAPPIPVLLTFDDGPHAGKIPANHTGTILEVLRSNSVKNGLVAVFFTQTHAAGGDGRPHRLGAPRGAEIAKEANARGHLIEVHTGSDKDHALHTSRAEEAAYDATGDGKVDGENALESDLIRAKSRIAESVGRSPEFVRAVGLNKNNKVEAVYTRVGLKHIGVSVDSKDNSAPRPAPVQVVQTLKAGPNSVTAAIGSGAPHLIILFHDINDITAKNLGEYIQAIDSAVKAAGKTPEYVTSREQAFEILRQATK